MTPTERYTVIGAIFAGVGLGIAGYGIGSSKDSPDAGDYEARLEQVAFDLQREQTARTTAEAEIARLRSENQALRNQSASPVPGSSPMSPSLTADAERSPQVAPSPRPRPANCTSNATFQCALPLAIGASDSDRFNRQQRYYRIFFSEAGPASFTLDPMPDTRWVAVTIYDSNYTKVEFKRFEKGQPGSFRMNVRQPGEYFAKLYPSACCGGAPDGYTFMVSR